MAIAIPPSFDYLKEQLDVNESIARDVFHLDIASWAKFRSTIAVGNHVSHLRGISIIDEARDAYRVLGKCHYEVVCSLAFCAKSTWDMHFGQSFIWDTNAGYIFMMSKTIKDFYFHAGALLDNLARLVYITNVKDAASAMKGQVRRMRLMDRTDLVKNFASDIAAYLPYIDNNAIKELVNVRNAMTHYWKIPFQNGCWPRSQLSSEKAYAWPYDEFEYKDYSDWQPIPIIIREHFSELLKTQHEAFNLLVTDVNKFETNNGVTIV
jgi:hypothetical protein